MAPFRILTVCTGNVCRSPIAENVLRERLSDVKPIDVSSAGFMALVGDDMPEQAKRLAETLGVTPQKHTSRQLTEEQILEADLVLAMSREHRREVVTRVPRASRYTVTVREFARLSADLGEWDFVDITALPDDAASERLTALVELIASRRGQVEPAAAPDDDDVADPFQQDDERYALTGSQLGPALEEVERVIRLALQKRAII
ncbi:protein-tyrosine phosphatase [Microbacteriaceae bacterium SG_E_30_P1]|uniref:protein-tyrosine-phosphatase n=1 Tax=Antiquaquibacter oligotrophicus TaxID=2880260 RepID=A0ABT6KPF1_9MICO|nr:low molecular weight phosphatase family protein [Antiquaquibacter oligotrophicus]MDH6181865.1 protein-tyrosine phosphatase [Antiquaquibacter oligotrophicus]UDF12458.1 low molecular weight phosphatase family protein [Antiquaquibacter oligotrophicus]